ncbi:hypothetical protein ACQ86D_51080 [Streptomyces galilaeus]
MRLPPAVSRGADGRAEALAFSLKALRTHTMNDNEGGLVGGSLIDPDDRPAARSPG